MNELPLVSIIIPCFNASPWLAQAIESALTQSYTNIEVLVIDDGSTDNSLIIAKQFGKRIHLFAEPHRGACAARNIGLKYASGKYIKFLDADDYLSKNTIEEQFALSESFSDEEKVIIYSSQQYINENGEYIGSPILYRNVGDDEDSILYYFQNNIQTSCPLHRRSFLLKVGGFDENLFRAQEYDLHLRLVAGGFRFIYKGGVSVFIRQHSSSGRISNVNFLIKYPLSDFERFVNRINKLESLINKPLPKSAKEYMAKSLWKSGREVLRNGEKTTAAIYFAEAKKMSPTSYMSGSKIYRLTTVFIGPYLTESIFLWVKAKSAFAINRS